MSHSPTHQTPLLAPEHEAEILARVEQNLLQEFRRSQRHAEPAPSLQTRLRAWLAWGMGAVAATAAVLFMVLQPWSTSVPLVMEGGAVIARGHTSSQRTVPLQVQRGKKVGVVTEAKRWEMTMAQHTRLALVKTEKHVRTVRLQRGFIKIHVHKGAMKRFTVESQGVQVVVTGTVFSVQREKRWVRVELFRGSVTVNHKGRQHKLVPGEGVRVQLESGLSHMYRFPVVKPAPRATQSQPSVRPTKQKAGPWERLRWLAKHKRLAELHRYALDLAESRQYSRRERKDMLKWVVEIEYANKMTSHAMKTLLAMARLGGQGSELLLGEAITTCRKIFRYDTSHCFHLSRRYLARYPKGLVRQEIACGLANDLVKHANTKGSAASLQEAKRLFYGHRCRELLCRRGKCPAPWRTLLKDE